MRSLLVLLLITTFNAAIAQDLVKIYGNIRSEQGAALSNVNIKVAGTPVSAISDENGFYSISTAYQPSITISFSLTGYVFQTIDIRPNRKKEIAQDIILKSKIQELKQVEVRGNNRPGNFTQIEEGLIRNFPTVSGSFEAVLKTLPGVSSNNELSSQYSVRGGNFDENLIYINDVEIFRPLLVRNGQQEGLSFINPELVSQASFSAGGFEARYGEKLSSVLDVRYNRPDSQQLVLSAGLLGLSATAKIPAKNSFTLIGIRTKTNQSILKTQPVSGTYQPKFYDFQVFHNANLGKKLDVSFFADYNLSRFSLIPESRETTFGTINEQFRLKVDYEGQEKDRYEAFTGAFTVAFKPSENWRLKWISSAFAIKEKETFDIEGSYIFDQLETDQESSNFGKIRAHRGIGVDFSHARNLLQATIYSTELRANLSKGRSYWEAGARFQLDKIEDQLNEYYLTDSAGYTLPYTPGPLLLTDVVNADNSVETNRFTSFIQNTISVSDKLTLSAGLRSNFNSFTNEFLVSPRLSVLFQPGKNVNWRIAGGSYNQTPFYRELRDFNGNLYKDSKAQRSLHFLVGSDRWFTGFGKKLKFSSEIYYKKLDNLIPYKVENLRVRYFAGQQSKGYATGADFSLGGEFVEGLESLFRVSLMKTEEDIKDDFYIEKAQDGSQKVVFPGYIKRPTDQRINLSAFFQDKLFNSPTYKVHLTLLYGSSLPVGPPQTQRYQDIYKIPSYRRVDIGFSKNFLEGGSARSLGFLKKSFGSLVAYAEVFNLLNINNTVSFLWIKDVNNNQFAIPNFLTSRQLNFKIIAKIKNR